MVGSIKNRIAAFEDMAVTSKSTSKLMSILPPEQGFAASKNRSSIIGPQKGKETSGYVSAPLKTNANATCFNSKKSMYKASRNSSNEQFNNDLNAYEKYKQVQAKASEPIIITNPPQEHSEPNTVMNPIEEQTPSHPSKVMNVFAPPGHKEIEEPVKAKATAHNPFTAQPIHQQELEESTKAEAAIHKIFTAQSGCEEIEKPKKAENEPFSGPVRVISVANNDNDGDELFSEDREQNISPLSFQSRKISSRASNRDGKLPDIPAIEEESPFCEEKLHSGRSHDSKEGPSMEESEGRNDVEESNDNDIFLHSFIRQNHDLSIASGRDVTLGSCLSESQHDFNFALPKPSGNDHEDSAARNTDSPISMGGPSIDGQEEYDNFTLGSGESDEVSCNNDKMNANSQLKENEEGNAVHGKGASAYMPRNNHTNGADSNSQQNASQESKQKTIDPLFLEDDSTDASGSAKRDDTSFSEYIDNMRPVPSFANDNVEDEYDDEKKEHNLEYDAVNENENESDQVLLTDEAPRNTFVYESGDEEDEELDFEDGLSEKVEDDVLHTGERMVQEISTANEEPNSTRHDITSDDYISGDDETFMEETNDNLLGIAGGIVQEFNINDEFGNVQEEMIQDNFNENVPFDESVPFNERSHQNVQDVDELMVVDDDQRENNDLSPVYYLEEDFEEDDYDGMFDEGETADDETADDETGDLLGVNFDELSMMSGDVIESSFVNPPNEETPQYPPQATYIPSTKELEVDRKYLTSTKFSFDNYQATQDRIDSMQAKKQNRNQQKNVSCSADHSVTDKSHLLTSIKEEQPVEPLARPIQDPPYKDEHFVRENPGSGPPLTIQNSGNTVSKQPDDKSETDEMSQITDASTYDIEPNRAKWRTSLEPQQRGDQTPKSEHSLMTYSLSESSSPSIVCKPQNGPIFRDRSSLSNNLKLKSTNSNVSEITDPNPLGFRRKQSISKGERKNNNDSGSRSGLSTINGASSSQGLDRARAPQSGDPSPFGRNGHSGRLPAKESSHKVEHRRGRKEEREFKHKRGFSWRSLSPFRRNSTKMEDKSLLKVQAGFRKKQARSRRRERPEFQRDRSFGSIGSHGSKSNGSSPGEILQEEEAMESKIPLVAVTLSDDSSQLRKPKKRFSFRNLSPFRNRSGSKKKSRGKIDPFDEGDNSL